MCEVNFRNVLICQADPIRPVVSLTMMGFRGGVEERMIGVHFYFDVAVSLGSWSRHLIVQV